jgi:hypothetical protein
MKYYRHIFVFPLFMVFFIPFLYAENGNIYLKKLANKINEIPTLTEKQEFDLISGRDTSKKIDQCIAGHMKSSEAVEAIKSGLKKAITQAGLAAYIGQQKIFLGRKPSRELDDVQEFQWTIDSNVKKSNLSKFSAVEFIQMSVDDAQFKRDNGKKANGLKYQVQFDIRGSERNNKRQDVFTALVDVEEKNKKWAVNSFKVLSGHTLLSQKSPSFTDATNQLALDTVPVYLRTEAIRRGGYALAVTDYNNDGIQDIFVGLRDGAEMYEGLKNGGFKKRSVGLEKEVYVKTAVFADYDNDGDQDVVINRFTPHTHEVNKEIVSMIDVVLYENENGNFKLSKKQIPTLHHREPMPSAVADFNGDGYLDLYVGFPGLKDFSAIYDIKEDSNKAVQGLYVNDRKGNFVDKTKNLDHDATYYRHVFPHSSLAIDYDQDGDSDLLVIDDRGNLSPIYKNTGKAQMIQSAEKIGIENYGYGMSIAHGDYNNDGITDLALTNVYLNEMKALDNFCLTEYASRVSSKGEGLRLFMGQKNGQFTEVTAASGLSNPGDATGGLAFLDYNNDGLQDLYVVNGLWSGTESGQDLNALFSASLNKVPFLYAIRPRDNINFMKILSQSTQEYSYRDGKMKFAASKGKPSLGGFQRNKLYRNNGDGTFTDVAFFEGVDAIEDGYVVGRADLNNDGVLDLVLRNADPGTKENSYAPVKVFMGKPVTSRKSVILTFAGSKSNKDAIGLYAVAKIKERTTVRHLVANSGSLQDQRMIHFGLGQEDSIDSLVLHWPSGYKQTLKNIKAGSHHIIESPTAKVSSINQETDILSW